MSQVYHVDHQRQVHIGMSIMGSAITDTASSVVSKSQVYHVDHQRQVHIQYTLHERRNISAFAIRFKQDHFFDF
jgi:hypothetical protein